MQQIPAYTSEILMRIKFLHGFFNNYQGLPKPYLLFISILPLLMNSISILLVFFFHSIVIFYSLIIASVIISFTFTVALKYYTESYSKQIDKLDLITRRFHNISKYFESILQDSTDIILSIDTDGYILKFNRGAQILLGYSQEEIVGKPFSFIFVNEADEIKIINTVLASGKSVNEEISLKTQNNKVILVEMSVSEMKNDNSIIGFVVTAKDITEKKKLEMELVKKNLLLVKLANTDSLTGLYNSRYFHDQIKRELSRLKRNPIRRLSLILLDIDHFKELNDSEGHQMGDHVLKSLGQVIRVCLRANVDTGYRYGGDEFVILLPDTDKFQAKIAAERIQKQFLSLNFGKTSLSMGISEAISDEDERTFIKRTDEAMYHSKREGKAKITIV